MADPSALPPAQFNQPSRKGKKAWRKNVDLTEIQSRLEQVRDDIISGFVSFRI
jgi:nucleolar protein 53